MKARRNLTAREIKIMEQFPVIGIHQMAANFWAAAAMCRQGIQDSKKALAELSTENSMTESEFEEFQEMISHVIFCEKTLYDVKIALNDIAWALN